MTTVVMKSVVAVPPHQVSHWTFISRSKPAARARTLARSPAGPRRLSASASSSAATPPPPPASDSSAEPQPQPPHLRVLLAAGGTGGHVYPAIAIADELRRLRPSSTILFAGTASRMEWRAVPGAGYPILAVPAAALRRPLWSPANLLLPLRLLHCLWAAWGVVHAARPHLVLGSGGYVAAPVCLAAALARVPVVAVHEQNAAPGVANRVLARALGAALAVVFLAFGAAARGFPAPHRCRVVGNPTRRALRDPCDRALAMRYLFPDAPEDDLDRPKKVILVLGGSLGAPAINAAVAGAAAAILAAADDGGGPPVWVAWQTGPRHHAAAVAGAGPGARHPRLAVHAFLDRMDLAYAAADLVVARAGAVTCSELLATGTPAILVPSPHVAEDHQTHNAAAMVRAGAARLLPQAELGPVVLAAAVADTLRDQAGLARMKECALRAATPDAAAVIARELIHMVDDKMSAAA